MALVNTIVQWIIAILILGLITYYTVIKKHVRGTTPAENDPLISL